MDENIIEQVSGFICLGNMILDVDIKLQTHSNINNIIKNSLAHKCQVIKDYVYITTHQHNT
jgi:hypothetical protein